MREAMQPVQDQGNRSVCEAYAREKVDKDVTPRHGEYRALRR